jgi:hypothetical protein
MDTYTPDYTFPPVLKTMEEKVAEYKNFFVSEKKVLIVYGINGGDDLSGAAISTEALEQALAEARGVTVIAFTDGPIPTTCTTQNDGDGEPVKKVVYHLNSDDHGFFITLQRKYSNECSISYFDLGGSLNVSGQE